MPCRKSKVIWEIGDDWFLGTPVESLSAKQFGRRPHLVGFAPFGQCRDVFGVLQVETGVANAVLPAV